MTPQISAKLVVASADAAIDTYRRVFGAELRQRYTSGDRVVYAQLELLGTLIELKDADEFDQLAAPGRPGVLLSVTTDDPDALAEAMVAAGGSVVFPVADQPYGARGGRVADPHGHQWLVQTPLRLSPEEIQRATAAMDG
ncbi:VOC family protein [Desertihabitans aurantiacus]|uniref:VOC family protein n=1 Tax=Desertihabitans aurantiacus TaxID=2282477 RepID=UPI000DF8273B|nr:VOC family protein [Desertihabitans aurantiacus]